MGFPGWPHVIAGKAKKGLNINIDKSQLIEYTRLMENQAVKVFIEMDS